jgi:DNA polymerase
MDERSLRELELAPVARLFGLVDAAVHAAPVAVVPPSVQAAAPDTSDPGSALSVAALGWEALRQVVRACTACGLCAKRKQAVFGVGCETGPWMFIGEGPGADEDEQGDPFVGQAGRLLDSMLGAAGLQRGRDVYIANVVKCRPPGNRTPTPEEAAACAPFLDRQIELVKPRMIVALGKTAAMRLLATEASLGSLRGRLHQYRGTPLVVTYHPAYLLRNLPDKAKAWEDLLLARRAMRESA